LRQAKKKNDASDRGIFADFSLIFNAGKKRISAIGYSNTFSRIFDFTDF